MASQEESAFYMAIQNPKDFRRELLNSSKGIIQLLQKYEDLKELREQKIALMYKFNDVMGEIRMLNSKLKNVIPKTKLRNMPKVTVNSKSKHKKEPEHDLSSLQQELSEIESKLNSLQ